MNLSAVNTEETVRAIVAQLEVNNTNWLDETIQHECEARIGMHKKADAEACAWVDKLTELELE